MSNKPLTTNQPDLLFEDTAVGRMKKELWEASDTQIDKWLADYDIPSPPEWSKPGSYIQTTVRHELIENRRKNDIVLIPVGSTENHGMHTISAMDTFLPNGGHLSVLRCLRGATAVIPITTSACRAP